MPQPTLADLIGVIRSLMTPFGLVPETPELQAARALLHEIDRGRPASYVWLVARNDGGMFADRIAADLVPDGHLTYPTKAEAWAAIRARKQSMAA